MKLNEPFDSPKLNDRLTWHCEPANWKIENSQLKISPDPDTDFWQRTHYGFQADNGHFLFQECKGDFILETHVKCDFQNQYDQAGLMVRVSDQCWIKTSVEYEPGEANKLGVVVTNNGYSDWSTQDVDDSFTEYKLRIIRRGSTYLVKFFNESEEEWVQMRMFHLFDETEVTAGLYCCCPKKTGFTVYFDYFKIDENELGQ
jgi:hypothetical protein